MTVRFPTPHPGTTRLTTRQVATALTALAREAAARDVRGDRASVIVLAACRVWLNTTAAQARAAQRRPQRCPHCNAEHQHTGEVAELLASLAVEL